MMLTKNEFIASVMILANVLAFVIVSFVNWDLLWWWGMNDWDAFERVFFILALIAINACAYSAAKETREKTEKTE